MIKLFYISLIFLFAPLLSSSQALDSNQIIPPPSNYYKKIYIGVSLGVSLPMGSFSHKNTDFDNLAFAKTGTNYNLIDAGYRIGNTLGVCASYFNVKNELVVSDLIRHINQTSSVNFIRGNSSNYQMNGLLLGLLISKKDKIIDLDLKFMGGISNIFIPQTSLEYKSTNTNKIETIQFQAISKNTYGVGLAAGFRVHLIENLDFMCHGNYMIFQNTFNRQVNFAKKISMEETKLNYEVFNINVGFAFRFLNDKNQ